MAPIGSVACVLAATLSALVFAFLPEAHAHSSFLAQTTVNFSAPPFPLVTHPHAPPPLVAPPQLPPPQAPLVTPPAPLLAPPQFPPPIVGPPPPLNCTSACAFRCHLHGRPKICIRACQTCCYRCNCVPPGTAGNHGICGQCYKNQITHGGKSKCP